MRIIEKTCPNCGANIEFNKGDEKVKCAYCKKTYVIEEDQEEYRLVLTKRFTNMFTIIFVFAFAMILLTTFIIVIGARSIGNPFGGEQTETSKPINSFKDISEDTIKEVHKTSVKVLSDNTNVTSFIFEQKEPFENKGMYLLIFDSGSTLYDIYSAKYLIKDEEVEVFTAIAYEDVNKNAKQLIGMHIPNTNPQSKAFMVGFASNEELYKNIVLKVKANKVLATEGLYTESE